MIIHEWRIIMKVNVKEEKCIGCGSCISLTDGNIFDFNDDGLAYVKNQPSNDKECEAIKNAINYCPTEAIEEIN